MSRTSPQFSSERSRAAIWIGCWLLVALYIGEAGLLALAPFWLVPIFSVASAAVTLVCWQRSKTLRNWARNLDLRWFLVPQVARLITLTILIKFRPDALSQKLLFFMMLGDTITIMAVALLAFLPVASSVQRIALAVWNALGFFHVIVSMTWFFADGFRNSNAAGIAPFLPFSLFLTFTAPLILVCHTLLFVRLLAENTSSNRITSEVVFTVNEQKM